MALPFRLEDEVEDGDVDGSGQQYKTIAELKQEEARKRAGADKAPGKSQPVMQLASALSARRSVMLGWCGFEFPLWPCTPIFNVKEVKPLPCFTRSADEPGTYCCGSSSSLARASRGP